MQMEPMQGPAINNNRHDDNRRFIDLDAKIDDPDAVP